MVITEPTVPSIQLLGLASKTVFKWFACSTKILLDSCRNIFQVYQNWARERKAFVAGWRVEPASLINVYTYPTVKILGI